MFVYISSSWKNRDRVRKLANMLRAANHEVYDFTDPESRKTPEIPPERFPEQFDPEKHHYGTYIQSVPEWRGAIECNKDALDRVDAVILLLPCGNDSHADWAYAVGQGKPSVVLGHPRVGERMPTHMWSQGFVDTDEEAVKWATTWDEKHTPFRRK